MIANYTRKLRILHDYYKKKGLLNLCKFVCANLVRYQKFTVFERDLSEPIEELPAKIPIDIRLVSREESDIDKLVKFWPDFYTPPESTPFSIKEMIINRLSVGEECMIAEYKGKIIHMNWIGFQNTHLFNKYVLKKGVSSEELIGYNIYTDPEYRHNKVVEAVFTEIFKYLKRKNYKKIINYVGSQNIASIKVTSKVYTKKTNTLYYIGIFGFGRYFLSKKVK